MAGGQPVGAVDFDSDSIHTFQQNFPMATEVACSSINNWKPNLRKGDIDVVIGGPPCQGFSLARGLRFVDDPRNSLYKEFVRVLEGLRPRWFVMENVEGIKNIGGGSIFSQILEDFDSCGYRVSVKVINMAKYGVPQKRKRAVFVGYRNEEDFEWPTEFFSDKLTGQEVDLFQGAQQPFNSVNAAISDLLGPLGNYFSHRANSQMRGPRNRDAHNEPAYTLRVRGDEFALCDVPAVGAFIPGPAPQELPYKGLVQNELQELLADCAPSFAYADRKKTKVFKTKKPPKLIGTRRLLIREQARLQAFPDWFHFAGRTVSQAKQIGNAVPPLFAYQLFKQIFEHET